MTVPLTNYVPTNDVPPQPTFSAGPKDVTDDPQAERRAIYRDLFVVTSSVHATGGIEDAEELADLMRAREERARGEVRWLAEGESVSDAHTE